MKLLEKDTHEKQDTLAALRLQLDQVKTLNLQMFHKAQVDTPQILFSLSLLIHSGRIRFNAVYVALKDSEREAEKKQAEAMQLEKKMDEMEKVMMELEQRYILCIFCVKIIFILLMISSYILKYILLLGCVSQTTELGARAQTK